MPTLSSKDIAERYAGRIVKCKLTNRSDPKSPVTDTSGQQLKTYEGRIVGWKKASTPLGFTYICVELIGGAVSQTKLEKFNQGYVYTHDRNPDGFGKKLLPEEIELPADVGNIKALPRKGKEIPEWPHKCQDCGSPAQIFGQNIDCSNPGCKRKFRTHSGMDLFLPKEMQLALAKPKVQARLELDKDGILICPTCTGYLEPTNDPKLTLWAAAGILNMECVRSGKTAHLPPHKLKVAIFKGDKMRHKAGGVVIFDGRRFI